MIFVLAYICTHTHTHTHMRDLPVALHFFPAVFLCQLVSSLPSILTKTGQVSGDSQPLTVPFATPGMT